MRTRLVRAVAALSGAVLAIVELGVVAQAQTAAAALGLQVTGFHNVVVQTLTMRVSN